MGLKIKRLVYTVLTILLLGASVFFIHESSNIAYSSETTYLDAVVTKPTKETHQESVDSRIEEEGNNRNPTHKQTGFQDNNELMVIETEANSIDIDDSNFSFTYEMAQEILFAYIEAQNAGHQIGLMDVGLRLINDKYYYAFAAYYNDDPDIVFTFAHYCVDVDTGESFELLSMTGFDELIKISIN